MRFLKIVVVITPIILGRVATWLLLAKQDAYKWVAYEPCSDTGPEKEGKNG
jgi:hypothetical protein